MEKKFLLPVIVLMTVILLLTSCDLLESDKQAFTIDKIQFEQHAVYTYEYLAWIEDTTGEADAYLADEVYKVKVLSTKADLPKADAPLIQLKTYKATFPGHNTQNEDYVFGWYNQDNSRFTHVASYSPAITSFVQPKEPSRNEMAVWLKQAGRLMVSPVLPMPVITTVQSTDDTLYHEPPRVVLRFPVQKKQEPFTYKAGPVTYKKEIVRIEKIEKADSSFTTFKIENTLQMPENSMPLIFTDYFADIGLVRRTLYSKQIRRNAEGDSMGVFVSRSKAELIDYQIRNITAISDN